MASPWQLEDLVARIGEPLSAVVRLDGPSPGLERPASAGAEAATTRLLAIQLGRARSAEGISAHVREGDLVATFEETPDSLLRVQAYWRTGWAAGVAGVLAGVDLEVSVQTSLLDNDPRLTTESRLPPAEVWSLVGDTWQQLTPGKSPLVLGPESGTSAILCRFAGEQPSYFEMTHPADFRRLGMEVEWGTSGIRIDRALFGHDLEKGVILRSRIRGGLVPRASDQTVARRAWQAFIASPLPLTT